MYRKWIKAKGAGGHQMWREKKILNVHIINFAKVDKKGGGVTFLSTKSGLFARLFMEPFHNLNPMKRNIGSSPLMK